MRKKNKSQTQGSTYYKRSVLKGDPCVFCGRLVDAKSPSWTRSNGKGVTHSMRKEMRKEKLKARAEARVGNPTRWFTIDHIFPTSSGGANAWWNYTAACNVCNSVKGSTSILEFMMGMTKQSVFESKPVMTEYNSLPDSWHDPLNLLTNRRDLI